jgi:Protein of unknown function (DUF3140)
MAQHTQIENQEAVKAFHSAVNMSAKELESWLKTPESLSVGMKEYDQDESTGHKMGRHLVEILHKKKSDYTNEDFAEMRRVVSYIHRHSAQSPDGEIEHTRWRYSLKNWGHDPLKD